MLAQDKEGFHYILSCTRIIGSKSILRWKRPSKMIIKSNSWLQRTTQNSIPMSESIVQTLLELCAHRPVVQPLSLTPSCLYPGTAPCRSLGPCHSQQSRAQLYPSLPSQGVSSSSFTVLTLSPFLSHQTL